MYEVRNILSFQMFQNNGGKENWNAHKMFKDRQRRRIELRRIQRFLQTTWSEETIDHTRARPAPRPEVVCTHVGLLLCHVAHLQRMQTRAQMRPTGRDIRRSDTLVTGTLPILSHYAFTIFDFGSTHSFISFPFVTQAGFELEPLIACIVCEYPRGGRLSS